MAREQTAVVKVRLSPPLRAKLDQAAETQKTSLNRQIEQRLERSFDLLDQLERIRIADAANKMLRNLTLAQRAALKRDAKDISMVISDCTEDLIHIIEVATRASTGIAAGHGTASGVGEARTDDK